MESTIFEGFLPFLILYYFVCFIVMGFVSKLSVIEPIVDESLRRGNTWPSLLGLSVIFSPILFRSLEPTPISPSWIGSPHEPFASGTLGIVTVFPVLFLLFFIGKRIYRNFRGDVISPSMCSGKKDPESLMICISKKFEGFLSEHYGAEGKGLHEKVNGVESRLDPDHVRRLRKIASVRNNAVHSEDFDVGSLDASDILRGASELMAEMAKREGLTVGSDGITSIGGIPGIWIVKYPALYIFSFSHYLGWTTAIIFGPLGLLFAFVIFQDVVL